jgi:hypothetical protein
MARALTGQVNKPVNAKAATPKMRNCVVEILMGRILFF